MHPDPFPIRRYSRFTPTACWWRRACCSGLWYARRQAPRAGLDPGQDLEHGHLHGSGRADRRQSLAYFQRLGFLRGESRAKFSASRRFNPAGRFMAASLGGDAGRFSLYPFPEIAAAAGSRYLRGALAAWATPSGGWDVLRRDAATASRLRCLGASRSRIRLLRELAGTPLGRSLCIPRSFTRRRRRIFEFSISDLAGKAAAFCGTDFWRIFDSVWHQSAA